MNDVITLTMPRERDFFRVAHLVLGGLAVRLDLTYEKLEDLQVALTELLRETEGEGDVTVRLRLEDGRIDAEVGPFARDELLAELARNGETVGLRRVLETVCDRFEVTERDGHPWVELTKTVR